MQREFVAVPAFWTVGEVIDFLRESDDLPDDFYDVFVVDPRHRLIGYVALNRILRAKRPVKIRDIMIDEFVSVPVQMDQEEVAYVFAQQDLVSAPVIDQSERLIGVITIDDIVDVIHQEAEEDLMRLGGVQEDDLYAAVLDTGKARFMWLFVNLITAVLASVVIGLFQGTIEQVVMLAVLMPIAASMGGNAGTQTLTVAVRALAMKELTTTNAFRVLSKEVLVGTFNGLLFAVIIGVIASIWSGSIAIGAVMAAAMVITMIIAGLAGAAIPLGLSRTRFDPAIASGVFLTTITDVVAFLAFLGLGAWFLV
jgi:magnesium transporter